MRSVLFVFSVVFSVSICAGEILKEGAGWFHYRDGVPVKVVRSFDAATVIAADGTVSLKRGSDWFHYKNNRILPALITPRGIRYLTSNLYVKPRFETFPADSAVWCRDHGLRFIKELSVSGWYYVETSEDPVETARWLVDSGAAVEAEPSVFIKTEWYGITPLDANDPYFPDQWTLHNNGPFTTQNGKGKIQGSDHAHIAESWQLIKTFGISSQLSDIAKNIRLALIDDGFDIQHEDLAAKFVASKNFGGAVEKDNLFSETASATANFHGTLVTGIAAATGGNGLGLSGACPGCRIIGARMDADPSSQGMTPDVYYDAIFSWVLDQNADVINCSWGPDDTVAKQYLTALIDKVTTQGRGGLGTVVVFASGNSGEDFSWNALATHPAAISVGAVNSKGARYSFSNFGAALDLMASTGGGEKSSGLGSTTYTDMIWSTDNFLYPSCLTAGKEPSSGCHETAGWNPDSPVAGGDGWWGRYSFRFSHTSAAAPLVSGVAALVLAVNPGLTAVQVREIMIETADKVSSSDAAYDAAGHSNTYGFGRVNALRAVAAAWALAGNTLSNTLKNDIEESSPCTIEDCWAFLGDFGTVSDSSPDYDMTVEPDNSGAADDSQNSDEEIHPEEAADAELDDEAADADSAGLPADEEPTAEGVAADSYIQPDAVAVDTAMADGHISEKDDTATTNNADNDSVAAESSGGCSVVF